MTRGTAAGIVAGAAIAACFSAPTRPGVPDDGDVTGDGIKLIDAPGTGVDASEADAMPGCVVEHFATAATDCGTWAQTLVSGGGSVGRASSRLYLAFGGSGTTGSASCRAAPRALDMVTFDMKAAMATPAGDSTFVGFIASNGSAYGLELRWESQNGSIGMAVQCPGALAMSPLPTWDPVADRYVRVARDSTSNAEVRVGSNTSSLTFLGSCPRGTQFNAAEITTVAYRPGSAAAGSAQIESLEYCPQ